MFSSASWLIHFIPGYTMARIYLSPWLLQVTWAIILKTLLRFDGGNTVEWRKRWASCCVFSSNKVYLLKCKVDTEQKQWDFPIKSLVYNHQTANYAKASDPRGWGERTYLLHITWSLTTIWLWSGCSLPDFWNILLRNEIKSPLAADSRVDERADKPRGALIREGRGCGW